MAGVHWDLRAVAQVTVHGTATDQKLFTDALDEQGWIAVGSRVPAVVTALAAGLADYTVEVRFPGSAYCAVTGARQRLEVLAERLSLELTVTAVDLVRGRPDFRPRWTVFRPAAGPQTPPGPGRLERLRRRVGEVRGTGRQTRRTPGTRRWHSPPGRCPASPTLPPTRGSGRPGGSSPVRDRVRRSPEDTSSPVSVPR
ncbi:hypothetical protein [Streptomyces sp. NPDC001292]|uniref:hypothetical protein n=1 Tax=Streptomyces sp. NPDC001292 TaxID=3364558 RepID=UPI0036AEC33A